VGSLDWTGCPDHPFGEVYAKYTALLSCFSYHRLATAWFSR